MSHCVACDAPLTSAKKWKMLDRESEEVLEKEENLCSCCLGVAQQTYNELCTMSNDAIEQDCKEMFYDEWANSNSSITELLDGTH